VFKGEGWDESGLERAMGERKKKKANLSLGPFTETRTGGKFDEVFSYSQNKVNKTIQKTPDKRGKEGLKEGVE